MSIPDAINGSFEALAGAMVALNCRALHRDKQVKGISMLPTYFFTVWGVWNLYYYPHLGQILSFIGGLSIVTVNTAWIGMMVYYRRREKRFGICPGVERFVDKARGAPLGSVHFVPEPGEQSYLIQQAPGRFKRVSRGELQALLKKQEARNA